MKYIMNRGIIYTALIGILMPIVFVDILLYSSAYIEIPFSSYLSKRLSFNPSMIIDTITTTFDLIIIMLVALLLAYPLGFFGHGKISLKILIFIVSYFLGWFYPWVYPIDKVNIIFVFTNFNVLFLLVLSILVMYLAYIKQKKS